MSNLDKALELTRIAQDEVGKILTHLEREIFNLCEPKATGTIHMIVDRVDTIHIDEDDGCYAWISLKTRIDN